MKLQNSSVWETRWPADSLFDGVSAAALFIQSAVCGITAIITTIQQPLPSPAQV